MREAALDLPASALTRAWMYAVMFRHRTMWRGLHEGLGRPVVAKPVVPPLLSPCCRCGLVRPAPPGQIKVLTWMRKEAMSAMSAKSRRICSRTADGRDSVARYCRTRVDQADSVLQAAPVSDRKDSFSADRISENMSSGGAQGYS